MFKFKTREQLIYLLSEAAELEHLLCIQYLFAAFSCKRFPEEGLSPKEQNAVDDWAQTILLVARQEMEHLGLVNNLLTSIGAAPHFHRPNLPLSGKYYPCPMQLDPLNDRTIKRFICFERPEHITPKDAFCHAFDHAPLPPRDPRSPLSYNTVGELYNLIIQGFTEIPLTDQELFIGPIDAQVGGSELDLSFNRVGGSGGVYDVTLFPIIDRVSALHALNLIIEQGEGAPGPDDTGPSHYERFQEVKAELKKIERRNKGFNPARDVVKNPVLWQHPDAMEATIITNPTTRKVMQLFNECYQLMLMLMMRFYAHTDETPEEINILKYAAFFPFMTMVIRPMAELLTTMPAFDDPNGPKAGASFELTPGIQFLPHKEAAWQVFYERLQQISIDMKQVSQLEGVPARVGYVAENLDLVAKKWKAKMS